MYERWTAEEDEKLCKVYLTGSKQSIAADLGKPWKVIVRRARRLKMVRPTELVNEDKKKRGPRKDAWSDAEEDLLRKVYPTGTKTEIISAIGRSWRGIWSRAYNLGLQRNEDVVLKEMIDGGNAAPPRDDFWSEDEVKTLKEVYPKERRAVIQSKFNRTWSSIRAKAFLERLQRDEEAAKADNVEATSAACMKKYGVPYSTLLPSMQENTRKTNIQRRGVPYPMQSPEVRKKSEETVKSKYGVSNVFKAEEVKQKIRETNIIKYGHVSAMQNPDVKASALETTKENNSFELSDEEASFYRYLQTVDPLTECQVMHPVVRNIIDFYMPSHNLWVQYDGSYWHGHTPHKADTPRAVHIAGTKERDALQNVAIPNLVRFSSVDVLKAEQDGTINELLTNKLSEKASHNIPCHQYSKKMEHRDTDVKNLGFDSAMLKASSFTLSKEPYSKDLALFIQKYEWLGTIGTTPKWCFTARYTGTLAGVVFINEPSAYSSLLGPDTKIYEALIQRGATASWTPKNLGSRMIMFACKWMVANTNKRIFVGYGDPKAHEIGTIYQACNFDYLGDTYGSGVLYQHPGIRGGLAFSAQSLKRTSAFKSWCRNNGIKAHPYWFKANHYKDLSAIPEDIKKAWYDSIKKVLSEATIIPISKKHKYALLVPRDKRELRDLSQLKTYSPLPYPKRSTTEIGVSDVPIMTYVKPLQKPRSHSSRSRITKEKDDFIIANYASMTKKEVAEKLGETERWVDGRIRILIHTGVLSPKNPIGSTKSRATQSKIDFIHANRDKMTYQELADHLGETKRWVKRQILKVLSH